MVLYKYTFAETQEFFAIANEIKRKEEIISKMSPRLQGFIRRWQERAATMVA